MAFYRALILLFKFLTPLMCDLKQIDIRFLLAESICHDLFIHKFVSIEQIKEKVMDPFFTHEKKLSFGERRMPHT